MKKKEFLAAIQQEACLGQRAAIVWDAAINADEKDPRWGEIEEYDLVGTFAAAFGVELPQPVARKPRLSYSEKIEGDIKKRRDHLPHITNPELAANAKRDIEALEVKLRKLKEEDL